MIDPNTDRERELIVDQLKQNKLVDSTTSVKLGKPYRLANRALRGYLNSDGKMNIVHLKDTKH
jgi:hypothetical protein